MRKILIGHYMAVEFKTHLHWVLNIEIMNKWKFATKEGKQSD